MTTYSEHYIEAVMIMKVVLFRISSQSMVMNVIDVDSNYVHLFSSVFEVAVVVTDWL